MPDRKFWLGSAVAVIGLIAIWAVFFRPTTVARSELAMGTFIEITATGVRPGPAVRAAFDEIRRIERLTRSDGSSDVARINAAAGVKPVTVSRDTIAILQLVSRYHSRLAGTFDPTVGPLVELWGFGYGSMPKLPSPQAVAKALPLVGFGRVDLDPARRTVWLRQPGMRLDLGGIAKGYAVDRAGEVLQRHGIRTALINAGRSSIRVLGRKNSGGDWRIGIGHPRRDGELLGVLRLAGNCALGTSADDQNYFKVGGRRYSHLLDPATGYPGRDKILVTVTAPSAAEADLLSTAFFVLDRTRIESALRRLPEVDLIIYDAAGHLSTYGEPNFKSQAIQSTAPN